METSRKTSPPVIIPKQVLKGKDGREPSADKIAKAKETLERYPIPDFILNRQSATPETGKTDKNEPATQLIDPNVGLKVKDGHKPFAQKLVRANEGPERVGLPEESRKKK